MLSFIRKQKLKDKEMRILMLQVLVHPENCNREAYGDSGLDNAGKTAIVKRLMGEDPRMHSPTLGFIIRTYVYEDQYRLNICELTKPLDNVWKSLIVG